MYLDDLIDLAELKQKTEDIRHRLHALRAAAAEREKPAGPEQLQASAARIVREVLSLENMTNAEARLLLDRIEAEDNGTATIFFRTS